MSVSPQSATAAASPGDAIPMSGAVDGDRVVTRVGRRMMWYLIALYVVSVLDRGNLSFASFSMNRQLGLTPQMYGVGVGILFLGYSLFELPSNLALARYGARVTLTRIAILFGLVTMSMAFVTGPYSFYTVRGLLGIAEAGLTPGVFLFLSYWIPQNHRARYNAMFTYAIPSAYVVSSLISGTIMQLDGLWSIPGWKWLFVLEGLPAVALGVFGIFYLTDRPHQAKWLSDDEKRWLQKQLDDTDTAATAPHLPTDLRSVLARPALWVLTLGYVGIFAGNATVGAWAPQILHGNGVSLGAIGLVAALPPLAGIVGMTFLSRRSDRRKERVSHTVACMVIAAAGYLMVAVSANLGTAIVGFMLANIGVYASLAIFWSIPQTYLPTRAKPAAIAIISSCGAILGGWVIPILVGRVQGQMHSLPAGMVVIAASFVGSAVCILFAGRRLAATNTGA
ncbi:MFS transporter [Paraburkholderia caballeronis]|uniref:MFS transporter n=1 Tax=Paraburkholderia caballeronis TaxID=416943 RepID=UPI001066CEA5|nr:MFS transporter [Paraburkholderia caballeronis]TDV19685.1 ACS family tartrate transporter-like MFS transporter [Paraburkholderia caballeronis]TDV22284.1 ACS family tartrate transporter-like MFS transporter [Paraburkholderia caballeronis]TDV29188.1 ACS family tartrate transporter-like MFS transporter [Paraburkholderia caballeronis]